ncbi:MAG: RNA polymerase sigma-70 factor [Alistipes sp.]|nr:RNA polymerase sigma-70 factor [Alistipes sp.]
MEETTHRDSALFAKLFEQYKEPFTRFANSFVRDTVVAESLFVDALVDYWQRRELLPQNTNVPGYVLTSLRNKALNYLRHQRIKENASDYMMRQARVELDFRINSLENFTIENLFTDDIEQIVSRTLNSVPEQTRRIFIMSRYEHLRNSEIAEQLGISIKTVEFHITKILKILRVNLKDYILCFLIFISAL